MFSDVNQQMVIVTGAKGFIGRSLCRMLSSANYEVVGIGHGAWTDCDEYGVMSWTNGDVSFPNIATAINRFGQPYALIHLAGASSVGPSLEAPYEDFMRSVHSTAETLEALRIMAPSTRMVYVSSAAVYGASYERPISVNDKPFPVSPYGHHKLVCELLVRSYSNNFSLKSAIVRPFSVYGAGLRKQLIWDICQKLSVRPKKLVLFGSGNEARDWIHVNNCCEMIVGAIGSAGEVPFVTNAGTGIATTIAEVANLVAKSFGSCVEFDFSGTARAGDPKSLISERVRDSQTICTALDDGISDYVTWYKKLELWH